MNGKMVRYILGRMLGVEALLLASSGICRNDYMGKKKKP